MSSTKRKLSDKLVSELPATSERYEVQDATEPAMRVRVTPSGVKTFTVLYRVRGSRRLNRYTLGTFGERTVKEYREEASAIVSDARSKGIDAAAALRSRKAAPTVSVLGKDYLKDCAVRLKPKTMTGYRSLWSAHIEKPIGPLKVTDVTATDVATLHRALKEKPYTANRVLNLLSSCFAYAITHSYRAKLTNPTDEVKPYGEKSRERFLSREELGRLLAALDQAEATGLPPAPRKSRRKEQSPASIADVTPVVEQKKREPRMPASPHVVGALRFLLLTGWREQEALTLQWDSVDLQRSHVTLEDTKTGKSQRPISAAAVALLKSMPQIHSSNYVFPSPLNHKRPIADIGHLWKAVRIAAKLEGLRLHDVRHSAASFAIGAGAALPVIGKMLGHKHTATTARYAHLTDDPVRAAMDAVAATMDAARATIETPVTPITAAKSTKRKARRSAL